MRAYHRIREAEQNQVMEGGHSTGRGIGCGQNQTGIPFFDQDTSTMTSLPPCAVASQGRMASRSPLIPLRHCCSCTNAILGQCWACLARTEWVAILLATCMGLQSTFTRDSPRSPASLIMCQRWCGQIGWPQSHNATLPGEWMSKAMVGTMDVLVLCLDFTVYSKDYRARKQLFLVQLNNSHWTTSHLIFVHPQTREASQNHEHIIT